MATETFTVDIKKINFFFLEKEIRAAIGSAFTMTFRQPDKLEITGDEVTTKKALISGAIAEHVPPTATNTLVVPVAATKTAVEAKVGQTITDPAELAFYLIYPGSLNKQSVVQPTARWWPKEIDAE